MNTLIDIDIQSPTKRPFLNPRKVVLIILSIIFLLIVATGVVGYIFSNMLLVPDHTTTYNLEVTNVTANSVTLPLSQTTEQPGTFGIFWPNQAAIIGKITAKTQSTITRQLLQTTVPLTNGTMVSWDRDIYFDSLINTLGLPIQTVQVSDPLGSMPAYYVPGKLNTWAIVVHGQNDFLQADLRSFPPLAQLGMPVLGISYRNDLNAPPSPDGLDHLGYTEWQDLQAGVQYAMQHGAKHIVLYGFSQGGDIVEMFMHHSTYASSVQAIVLDSPVLDWRSTLNFQAASRGLPAIFADAAELVTTIRTGVNFNTLDQLDQKQGKTPILLFQGTADTTTPPSVSTTFAQQHPDIVTYYPVTGANHVQSWNLNSQLYDSRVDTFLSKVLNVQP
jgi:pimeloyl-ACP methyl ester carboxylesterase